MFSLTHKVSRKEFRLCCFVCYNQDFTRSCNHININSSVEQFLCRCNKNVSGAYNFVHLRHGLSSVGKGGNSLRTTHKKNPVNTCNLCGGDNIWVRRSVLLGRSTHNHLFNSRNLCRNYIHQNGRGISSCSAGNINSHTL